MEDSIDDIVHQLGANDHRRVSFVDFARCRRGLLSEIEREKRRSLQEASLQRGPWQGLFITRMCGKIRFIMLSLSLTFWWMPSDDCVAPVSLFQLMEDHDPDALRQMLHYAQQTSGLKDKPNFAELANTVSMMCPGVLTLYLAELIHSFFQTVNCECFYISHVATSISSDVDKKK